MKVAFWSNSRGRSCVTSNLACISVLSALDCPQDRTIVFENHRNIINLGSTLFNFHSRNEVREDYRYELESGLGRVLRLLERGEEMTEDHLYGMAEDYLGKRLFYLSSEGGNAENLEYYMEKEAVRAMECLERYSDMVIVDTTSAPLASSRQILRQADLVVVNLNQNQQFLDHFFRNYSSIQKKAFYLVGNYDACSQMTRGEIVRRYHIPGGRIGVIPHNAGFQDAVSNGRCIPFLIQNHSHTDSRADRDFMKAAKEAVELFHDRIRLHEERSGRV